MVVRERRKLGVIARHSFLFCVMALAIAGCAESSSVVVKGPGFIELGTRTIAIEPPDDLFDDGRLARSIGVELAKRGYAVDDQRRTLALLRKNDVKALEILTPGGLATLRKNGVDAVLSINASAANMGGPPNRYVEIRILSTSTGQEIGSVEWKNSWAGMPGSPADYVNREGVETAGVEIADKLAKLLG